MVTSMTRAFSLTLALFLSLTACGGGGNTTEDAPPMYETFLGKADDGSRWS